MRIRRGEILDNTTRTLLWTSLVVSGLRLERPTRVIWRTKIQFGLSAIGMVAEQPEEGELINLYLSEKFHAKQLLGHLAFLFLRSLDSGQREFSVCRKSNCI